MEREDVWWNAPKTALGETTTLQEKIRAFRHWMHVVRKSGSQQSYLKIFPGHGNVFEPFDTRLQVCEQVSQELGTGRLLHPETVLRCVHEQWSKLQVYIDVSTSNIVRIKGKALVDDDPVGTSGPVARDDLWMAFSIGMQWCSRFTRLLPEGVQKELVDYMSRMRILAQTAMQRCLREAALGDNDDAINSPLGSIQELNTSLAVPEASTTDALVAIWGVILALQGICKQLREFCRSLIVAFASHGWATQAGFSVKTRRIVRQQLDIGQTQRFWKEQVGRQLQKQQTSNFVAELGRIQRDFSVTRSTLRILCAAPHRASVWPMSLSTLVNAPASCVPIVGM